MRPRPGAEQSLSLNPSFPVYLGSQPHERPRYLETEYRRCLRHSRIIRDLCRTIEGSPHLTFPPPVRLYPSW